jgi:diaminopimelate epimerase
MIVHFEKFQATGNDFILIDDRKRTFDTTNNPLIKRLCDRRFGIGADGLILLRNEPEADFQMVYFNADGYEGSMCGNGGRAITAFAHSLEPIRSRFRFIAYDGAHESSILASVEHEPEISLAMQNVTTPEYIGTDLFLNTGSPHYVVFVDDVASIDVVNSGRSIRNSERFIREGVNVNFVEVQGHSLFVRTYERGVEDETLSCGTGVTASALAAYFSGKLAFKSIRVKTPGGDLHVSFEPEEAGGFKDIILTGNALKVFEGKVEV